MLKMTDIPAHGISSVKTWLTDRRETQLRASLAKGSASSGTSFIPLPGGKALRFLTGLVLGLMGGLGLLMAAAILPGVFGFTPLVVMSGSMEPTLNTGDIAVSRRVDPAGLQLGDVVTYNSTSGLVTHRIVGLDMTPQGPFFQMKGDANLSADPRPIPAHRIVAKVVYRIPRVGFLVSFTDSMLGKLFLIAAPVVLLILMWFRRKLAGSAPVSPAQVDSLARVIRNRLSFRRLGFGISPPTWGPTAHPFANFASAGRMSEGRHAGPSHLEE